MNTDLIDQVRQRLTVEQTAATDSTVADAVRSLGVIVSEDDLARLVSDLRSELTGAGPLDVLLNQPGVTDVLVNGPESVWMDAGDGLQQSAVRFSSEEAVRRLAQRLAVSAGRRLDDATPFVDARLASGVRLHAILPPVSPHGTCISLRIPRRRVFTLTELVERGTLPQAGAAWLRALIDHRCAVLISGGTGTGKTTLLSALLSIVNPADRILIVEDSGELDPAHPHVVRLEARPANVEGRGHISLRDLVRQALRMRPDRLVVGEVRGAEVVDLLAALNTGHEGGCGTVHANSAADVPARLEALALAAGMNREALHSQVAAGLDAVVHIDRDRDGVRRISGIHVIERGENGLVRAVPAVSFDIAGVQLLPGSDQLLARLESNSRSPAMESGC